MLAGGLFTDLFAVESHMQLAKGDTKNYSENMSQTELAEALDVTFQQIQNDGRNNQRDGSGADLTGFLATSEGIALCSAFQQIESEGMRNAVINFLQGLITKD